MGHLERVGELTNQNTFINHGLGRILSTFQLYLKCPLLLMLKYIFIHSNDAVSLWMQFVLDAYRKQATKL